LPDKYSLAVRTLKVTSNIQGGTNIIIGTDGGPYLLDNNSPNWTPIFNGLPNGIAIMTITTMGSNIFAGTNGAGVYLSTNNGTNWIASNDGIKDEYLWFLYNSGTSLYAGTNTGIFISTNNGINWSSVNNGIIGSDVHSFAVIGSKIYAGTYGQGVYFSSNNGSNWAIVNNGLLETNVNALSASSDGKKLIAGTAAGCVFLSTNSGTDWTWINQNLNLQFGPVYSMVLSDTNLFVGTEGGGIFLLTPNGTNWIQTIMCINGVNQKNVWSLAASSNENSSKILFAGTDSIIFRSTNEGVNWTPIGLLTGFVIRAMTVSLNGNILAGTLGGIYLSTNNGASWNSFNKGLPNNVDVFSLFNTPDGKGGYNIVAGTDNGVFAASDNDTIWTDVSTGLTNTFVQAIALTTNDAGITSIFAGTSTSVWKRPLTEIQSAVKHTTGINNKQINLPTNFSLQQNYPNPFNPTTTINYSVAKSGIVKLKVCDLLGREVAQLVNENKPVGNYSVQFNASKLVSGIYFYRMESGSFSQTKKLLLLK